MSGQLVGNTPWGRAGIRAMKPEDVEAIQDRIPDGTYISVGAATKPGDWTLVLLSGRNPVATVYHQRTIEGGCVSLLQLAAIEEVA